MSDRSDIFSRQRLTAGRLRAVAKRRFDDARAPCDSGQNARANEAPYLAGIVIEILLKRQLVKLHPSVAPKRGHEVTSDERLVWNLIWRSHDLTEMLDQLPLVRAAVEMRSAKAGQSYLGWLLDICNRWTIFARYSSLGSTMAEARMMVERVRLLKEVI